MASEHRFLLVEKLNRSWISGLSSFVYLNRVKQKIVIISALPLTFDFDNVASIEI